MRPFAVTILLLLCSNVFMTFAWYAHLKNLSAKPWIVAVLVSWGIAFFEYVLQVPANRAGIAVMKLGQLKILQEVIALSVFVPFSVLYMKEKLTLDICGRPCALPPQPTSCSDVAAKAGCNSWFRIWPLGAWGKGR
ncbi:MAG: DMT family protein, partial [Fuerstiella sp.]